MKENVSRNVLEKLVTSSDCTKRAIVSRSLSLQVPSRNVQIYREACHFECLHETFKYIEKLVTSSDCTERSNLSRSLSLRVFSEGKFIEKCFRTWRRSGLNSVGHGSRYIFCNQKTLELTNTRTDDIKAKKTTPNGVVFL